MRRESEFDFEKLFELTPDLLCIAGYDGYFKKVNSAVAKTLGYSKEELHNHPINDFIHPDDLSKTADMRGRLINKHVMVNYENRYITKTGQTVWLSWTSKAAEKGDFIFAVAKNISEKKREEKERISHLGDLSERNKNFEKLSYTTSHDLRAPLDNILTIIQLIDSEELGQQNAELVNLLGRATMGLKSRLSKYIDDLDTSHTVKVKIETIDFKGSLNEVLFSLKHLIETSQATIHSDFKEVEGVLFNREYMESIFLNLVSNAIKYSRPDVPGDIRIYSKFENKRTVLFVEDNGMGFDLTRVKDRIFGLHQTFHKNADSRGIGLHLVYTHITSLGGTIAVESEVNKGTKFRITFVGSH